MLQLCAGRRPVINIVDVLKPADEVSSQRKQLYTCYVFFIVELLYVI